MLHSQELCVETADDDRVPRRRKKIVSAGCWNRTVVVTVDHRCGNVVKLAVG